MADLKLELVLLPVSDVDRAKAFYTEQLGFHLDVDHQPAVGGRRGGAGATAPDAGQGDRGDPTGQATGVDHIGDRADRPVLAVGPGKDEDLVGVTRVGGESGYQAAFQSSTSRCGGPMSTTVP